MTKKHKLKKLFSDKDERFILDNYLIMDYQEIADRIKVKRYNIVYFLKRNGLEGTKKKILITDEQISFIKENYYTMTLKEISEGVGINKNSLGYYIKYLNLPPKRKQCVPLNDEQKKYCIENFHKGKSASVIAKEINATKSQVSHIFKKNNLKRSKQWTKEMDDFLLMNYKKMELRDLAEAMNRKESAILLRLSKLGIIFHIENQDIPNDIHISCPKIIDRKRKNKHWTENELEYLFQNFDNQSDEEIGITLHRSAKAVKHQRNKYNLFREHSRSNYELEIETFLKENNIDFEIQYYLDGYRYDFKIGNTLIEFNGDFYHCNPEIYINGPINQNQIYTIEKDKNKQKTALINNYKFLIIWEKDFIENKESILHNLLAVS